MLAALLSRDSIPVEEGSRPNSSSSGLLTISPAVTLSNKQQDTLLASISEPYLKLGVSGITMHGLLGNSPYACLESML
ncbi:hypothetical protein ACN38_g2318 [Penicillium nordicum]|uniref:Uncharacterized protein n=1 Tax=Penicillium nordicum TaxID=229535 RepID=A0A0M9WJ01_9EURO|nr:hypothetical protein ACN38_g2318 [Penicillium nordicum]